MKKDAFLRVLEDALERDPGSIQGDETLESIEWDSLAVVVFLAVVDEHLELELSAKHVNECQTVPELLTLLG